MSHEGCYVVDHRARMRHASIKIPSRSDVGESEGNEKGDREFIIREVHNIPQHTSNSTSSNVPIMTIGKALLVLSHSNPNDWVYSFLETDLESPSRKAFMAIDNHIQRDPSAATMIAISILDQVSNSQSSSQQEKIGKQFDKCKPVELLWWIFMRHPPPFQVSMTQILGQSGYHNSIKLAVCTTRTKKSKSPETEQSNHSPLFGFSQLLSPLVALIKNVGSATRLSTAAGDCLLRIFSVLSLLPNVKEMSSTPTSFSKPSTTSSIQPVNRGNRLIVEISNWSNGDVSEVDPKAEQDEQEAHEHEEQEQEGNMLIRHLAILLEALREMKKWYEKDRILLSIALSDIASTYESLQARKKPALIVKTWNSLSKYICLAPPKLHVQHLAEELPTHLHMLQDVTDEKSYYWVICLGLLCSAFAKKSVLHSFLDTHKELIFPALSRMLIYNPNSHLIIVTILLQVMFEDKMNLGNYIYDLLPEILDSKFEMNSSLINFMAEVILRCDQYKQQKLVARTIANLDSTTEQQRNDATSIIINVIKGGPDAHTKLLIQHAFVSSTINVELYTKMNEASAYHHLDVDYFVPKLVQILRVGKESTKPAEEILVSVVCNCSDPEYAIKALLDACRTKATVFHSPADIGTTENEGTSDALTQILDLIPMIAKKLDNAFWHDHLPSLIQHYLKTPEDTVLVKFLAKISYYIGENLNKALSVLVPFMRDQPCLTEELLLATSPESEEEVKHLLFERLAPLLVLKVVPYTLFYTFWEKTLNQNSLLVTVRDLLLTRMTQVFEFEEVRRVSAQVLSYLPPPVWALSTLSVIQHSLHQSDHYTAKICIFCWFNGLSIQGEQLSIYVQVIASILLSILVTSCPPATATGPSETQKLQFGAIDCLALMMKTALTAYDSPSPPSHGITSLPTGQETDSSTQLQNKFSGPCKQHLSSFKDIPTLVLGLAMYPYPLQKDFQLLNESKESLSCFCVNITNSVINCTKASGANYSLAIAHLFLTPLLDSICIPEVHNLLTQAYTQAVLTLIPYLSRQLHTFADHLSKFLSITLTNNNLKMTGLKVLHSVCIHDPSIVPSSVATILSSISIFLFLTVYIHSHYFDYWEALTKVLNLNWRKIFYQFYCKTKYDYK